MQPTGAIKSATFEVGESSEPGLKSMPVRYDASHSSIVPDLGFTLKPGMNCLKQNGIYDDADLPTFGGEMLMETGSCKSSIDVYSSECIGIYPHNQCYSVQDIRNCSTCNHLDSACGEGGCYEIPHTILLTKQVELNVLAENHRFGSATRPNTILQHLSNKQANVEDAVTATIKAGQIEMNFTAMDNTPKLVAGSYLSESYKEIDLDLNLAPKIQDDASSRVIQELKSEYNACATTLICKEPENRWTKRLKLNTFTAQGTKVTQLGEKNKNCSRVSINSGTETSSVKNQQQQVCQAAPPQNKSNGPLLSDAWIRRWLPNRQKSEAQTMDNIQSSRFPSIAARALTGKVLLNFKSCKLKKNGSISMWYARAF